MAGTIFGSAITSCTQRVFVVAYEVGADVKLSPINVFKGEQKQTDHLARHPFGVVPAYESADGKAKLFESRAIARYIDAKTGGKLAHKETLEDAALVETWISVESANFEKTAFPLVYEEVFKKMRGLETNVEEAKKHFDLLAAVLDVYEKELSTRNYLAGNKLSLADLYHLPTGTHAFKAHPELLEARPHVKKWWESLANLPSWQKTLALHTAH